MTIILCEITFCLTSLSFKGIFCLDQKTLNVKWRSQQNSQVIAISCLTLMSILPSCCVNSLLPGLWTPRILHLLIFFHFHTIIIYNGSRFFWLRSHESYFKGTGGVVGRNKSLTQLFSFCLRIAWKSKQKQLGIYATFKRRKLVCEFVKTTISTVMNENYMNQPVFYFVRKLVRCLTNCIVW